MRPLFPNPGGVVDPDDLVGRDAELLKIKEAISRSGGAYVTGERRMGKTSILKKLHSELEQAGRVVIRLSAETDRIDTFTERLLQELRTHRLISRGIAKWEKEVSGEFALKFLGSGLKLSGKAKKGHDQPVELDLMQLLSATSGPRGAVLIIDEITVLCNALGPENATAFLGDLRAHRQGERPLAVVISGSIGLHHALPDTRVINDLWQVNVGALRSEEASELVNRLVLGVGVEWTHALETEILQATSGIPYYVQAVVQQLADDPDRTVNDIVDYCINENLWNTEHYDSRLDDYFGRDDARLARAVLDELAMNDALDVDSLTAPLSAVLGAAPDRDDLLRVLRLLEKDHYLTRESMTDRMSSQLLQRIWRTHRRLG
ncbi:MULTISPECIES: AAA family ATPase [Gordonia]|uniref:AAA family ATPase n=1 Tax=Gordonia TaxID=2053 RepID=UPI0007EB718D|nr:MULTISPECIES: ATP-binding protein [Gordonia]MCM3895069.1 ATP-binding protein [Gordonia sputi]OBA42757.1 hypothetical protein A5766_18565 [Gordonia sp. 852002-51296_SCH5728562-b]